MDVLLTVRKHRQTQVEDLCKALDLLAIDWILYKTCHKNQYLVLIHDVSDSMLSLVLTTLINSQRYRTINHRVLYRLKQKLYK